MAACRILIADNGDNLDVEIHSNDISAKESKANLFAAWIAANWQEIVLLFRAQLTAAQQEATGEQPIAQPSSPILGANGAPIDTNLRTADDHAAQAGEPPQRPLFNSPSDLFNGA
jgi:hypothetical protein